jgi:hypothetical protein
VRSWKGEGYLRLARKTARPDAGCVGPGTVVDDECEGAQAGRLGRAFRRGVSPENISCAERTGGATAGSVLRDAASEGDAGAGDAVGDAIDAVRVAVDAAIEALADAARDSAALGEPFDAAAPTDTKGSFGPRRRLRASSIERPMFWMIERTCWMLRVGRGEFMSTSS